MKMRLSQYPLLTMALMLLTGLSAAAQSADSPRITSLLQQAKEHAAGANRSAELIDSYTRGRLTWQSHTAQLNRMKTEVNELGKDIADLTAARPEGSLWQQDAIDKIDPLLRSMADHLGATIRYLGANQSQVHMPPYKDYAKANYEYSEKMLTMINDYIDYAESRAKAEALEQKLLLPGGQTPGEE